MQVINRFMTGTDKQSGEVFILQMYKKKLISLQQQAMHNTFCSLV